MSDRYSPGPEYAAAKARYAEATVQQHSNEVAARRWTAERSAAVRAMHNLGASYRQIAADLGIARQRAQQLAEQGRSEESTTGGNDEPAQ